MQFNFILAPHFATGGSVPEPEDPGLAHRHWRMVTTNVFGGGDVVFVRELKFMETFADDTYGHSLGTASASSEDDPAAEAFDGNSTSAGNAWNSAAAETLPQWVAYDFGLGNERTVAAIRYKGSNGLAQFGTAPTAIRVEFSDVVAPATDADWELQFESEYFQGWGLDWIIGNPELEIPLQNPDFETGDLTGWTGSGFIVGVDTDGDEDPFTGTYLAYIPTGTSTGTISQVVDVPEDKISVVDTGTSQCMATVALNLWSSFDTGTLTVRFLDAGDVELGSIIASRDDIRDGWIQLVANGTVPTLTRKFEYELDGADTASGSTATVAFDDARLFLQDVRVPLAGVAELNRYIILKEQPLGRVIEYNRYSVLRPVDQNRVIEYNRYAILKSV